MRNNNNDGQKKLKEAFIKDSTPSLNKNDSVENDKNSCYEKNTKSINKNGEIINRTGWACTDSFAKRVAIVVLSVVLVAGILLSIREIKMSSNKETIISDYPYNNTQIEQIISSHETVTNTEAITASIETTDEDNKSPVLLEYFVNELATLTNNEYCEFINSNDQLKITARIYMQKDANGDLHANIIYPIPVTITIENVGELDIYQFIPNSCFASDKYMHHHQLEINVNDKHGNKLVDITGDMELHENMIAQYKLSPGDTLELYYFLAPGRVIEEYPYSSANKNTVGIYTVTYGWHSSYVELYDYSEKGEFNELFSGTIAFSYKYDDNMQSINNQSISVEVTIPVCVDNN